MRQLEHYRFSLGLYGFSFEAREPSFEVSAQWLKGTGFSKRVLA